MTDTAGHEAAHVIVALEFGIHVRNVKVHERGGGLTTIVNDAGKRSANDVATVAAAGREYARLRIERGGGGDYVEELDAAAYDLEMMRREIPGDTDDAREMRGQAMDRARAILERRWDDVQRLADRLHERRTLNADEIAAVIGRGTAPTRSAPAAERTDSRQRAGQAPPWLVATRALEVRGHEVIPGVSRCLPGSPAHRADPSAWRPMRSDDGVAIETRSRASIAVR